MPVKKSAVAAFLSVLFLMTAGCASGVREKHALQMPDKKYDLVLVHGLSNMYCWSDAFLLQCLNIWGSGNVYAVYTDESTRVWERDVGGKRLICCGEDNYSAGDDDIETQSVHLHDAVATLQESYGLNREFCIIAHSMGGLVSRQYIDRHPGTVVGLVTLASPHHGSPLADSFGWIGFFLGAGDAVDNLRPDYMDGFNRQFPVPDAVQPDNCKIYTIRGDSDGYDSFGWGSELFFGWPVLRIFYGTDNDGIVPSSSTLLDGAVHIADFPDYDHYDMVREPDVAVTAAEYLP